MVNKAVADQTNSVTGHYIHSLITQMVPLNFVLIPRQWVEATLFYGKVKGLLGIDL